MALTETTAAHQALTPDQVRAWLDTWGNTPNVRNYLNTGNPEYGIIAHVQQTADVWDDFLLYIPHLQPGVIDLANLHITLVTGNPVVDSVNKAPYVSPDDIGFWQTLQKQLDDALKGAGDVLKWAVVGIIALVALQFVRK